MVVVGLERWMVEELELGRMKLSTMPKNWLVLVLVQTTTPKNWLVREQEQTTGSMTKLALGQERELTTGSIETLASGLGLGQTIDSIEMLAMASLERESMPARSKFPSQESSLSTPAK